MEKLLSRAKFVAFLRDIKILLHSIGSGLTTTALTSNILICSYSMIMITVQKTHLIPLPITPASICRRGCAVLILAQQSQSSEMLLRDCKSHNGLSLWSILPTQAIMGWCLISTNIQGSGKSAISLMGSILYYMRNN